MEKSVEMPKTVAPAPKKSPMSSIFTQSNKDKFAKKPEPVVPVVAESAEKEAVQPEKKKKVMKSKHAEDENTLFVGNLPGKWSLSSHNRYSGSN